MEPSCHSLITPGLIDSSLKLRLVLLFYRHPCWSGSSGSLSEWLCESPWALGEALESLVEVGFLLKAGVQGDTHYRLDPGRQHWSAVDLLVSCFEDPLKRDHIYRLIRAADQERQFRAWLASDLHVYAAI
ncbi:MAG TPA: hypothetical protein VF897_14470 [Roseiflexaceae bacterium]